MKRTEELARSIWKQKVVGQLGSALAFTKSGLILVKKNEERLNALVLLQPETGDTVWEKPLEAVSLKIGESVALATDPDGAVVYVMQDNGIAAYDASQGKPLWSNDSVGDPSANIEHFVSEVEAVVTPELILLTSTANQIVALDRHSGQVRWRAPGRAAIWLGVQGGLILSWSSEDASVQAHELATGKLRWKRPLKGSAQESVRIIQSLVLLPPGSEAAYFLDSPASLVALAVDSGTPLFVLPVGGPVSFALGSGTLVVADGTVVRGVHPKTGAVQWERPAAGPAVVAPLDAAHLLLQTGQTAAVLAYANGQPSWQGAAAAVLDEQDGVVAAQPGLVVMAVGQKTLATTLRNGTLVTAEVGAHDGDENARPWRVRVRDDRLAVLSRGSRLQLFTLSR